MHAAGREFDEKQDIEALQEERVDSEEVALENARRLLAQELGPACLEPLRRRLDPFLVEDRPDRAGGDLDAEADQLALDLPVPPARVLPREPHDQLTHLGRRPGPAQTPQRAGPAARD